MNTLKSFMILGMTTYALVVSACHDDGGAPAPTAGAATSGADTAQVAQSLEPGQVEWNAIEAPGSLSRAYANLDADMTMEFIVDGDKILNAVTGEAEGMLPAPLPAGARFADIDGDGHLDFVSADGQTFLGDGALGFRAAGAPLTAGSTAHQQVWGDWDADGDLDLFALAGQPAVVHGWENRDGQLDVEPAITLDHPAKAVMVGDSDADGMLELAWVRARRHSVFLDNEIGWAESDGSWRLVDAQFERINRGYSIKVAGVRFADLDSQLPAELVVTSGFTVPNFSPFGFINAYQPGSGGMTNIPDATNNYAPDGYYLGVEPVDLNFDGLAEWVTLEYDETAAADEQQRLRVFERVFGNEYRGPYIQGADTSRVASELVDIDGDGLLDLNVEGAGAGPSEAFVRHHRSALSTVWRAPAGASGDVVGAVVTAPGPGGEDAVGIRMVVASADQPLRTYMRREGQWVVQDESDTTIAASDVTSGIFGPGEAPAVAIATHTGVSIWSSGEDGLAPDTTLDIGRVLALSTGDLDGDGRDDLAVSTIDDGLQVWMSTSDGFVQGFRPVEAADTRVLRLDDLDADGDLDLLEGNAGADRVFVNDGSGAFALAFEEDAVTLTADIAAVPTTEGLRLVGLSQTRMRVFSVDRPAQSQPLSIELLEVVDAPKGARALAVGDLDNDTVDEMVVAGDDVTIFEDLAAQETLAVDDDSDWRGASIGEYDASAGIDLLLVGRDTPTAIVSVPTDRHPAFAPENVPQPVFLTPGGVEDQRRSVVHSLPKVAVRVFVADSASQIVTPGQLSFRDAQGQWQPATATPAELVATTGAGEIFEMTWDVEADRPGARRQQLAIDFALGETTSGGQARRFARVESTSQPFEIGCRGPCCANGARAKGAGEVCRPAAGACDVAEVCDGVRSSCPADDLADAGTVCGQGEDACIANAVCDGASALCPAEELPNGTTCEGGNACQGRICIDGDCVGDQPVDCDDGVVCTYDACDAQAGCVHEPIEGCCAVDSECTAVDGGVCQDNRCVYPHPPPTSNGGNAGDNTGQASSGGCQQSGAADPTDAVLMVVVALLAAGLGRRRRLAAALMVFAAFAAAPATVSAAEIHVTTTEDVHDANDGFCSLREAILSAGADASDDVSCGAGDGADTIVVSAGEHAIMLDAGTNPADYGAYIVDSDITIIGAGAQHTTITTDVGGRLFEVGPAGRLRVESVALTGGDARRGGVIRAEGALELAEVTVRDLAVTAPTGQVTDIPSRDTQRGGKGVLGGVIHFTGSSLHIADSRFVDNDFIAGDGVDAPQDYAGGGGGVLGGIIYANTTGTVTLERTLIENCWSYAGRGGNGSSINSGPAGGGSALGAALFVDGGAQVSIQTTYIDVDAVQGQPGSGGGGKARFPNSSRVAPRGDGGNARGAGGLGGGGGTVGLAGEYAGQGSTYNSPLSATAGIGRSIFVYDGAVDLDHVSLISEHLHATPNGVLSLKNTLALGALGCDVEDGGTATSRGHNMFAEPRDTWSPCPTDASDIHRTAFGSRDNRLLRPAPDGEAIDAGTCELPVGGTMAVDMRGLPVTGPCDIGAIDRRCTPNRDGDTCTSKDICVGQATCEANECVDRSPVDCAHTVTACRAAGSCDPDGARGNCDLPGPPRNELGPCDDGDACVVDSYCSNGACIDGRTVTCPATESSCIGAAFCDPAGAEGNCDLPGQPIRDGEACGQGAHCVDDTTAQGASTCQAGQCTSPAQVTCNVCWGAGRCETTEPREQLDPDADYSPSYPDAGTHKSSASSGGCAQPGSTQLPALGLLLTGLLLLAGTRERYVG